MLARTADCKSEGNGFYTSFLLTWIFTEVRSDVCDRFVDGAEFDDSLGVMRNSIQETIGCGDRSPVQATIGSVDSPPPFSG